MNAPRYKTAARQGLPYDAEQPLETVVTLPARAAPTLAVPERQTLASDDMGMQTQPHVVVWQPIEDAPQDGSTLMVKLDLETPGPGRPAVWHRTRRWEKGRWVTTAYWGDPVNKWRLTFEPQVWRSPVYGQGQGR